LNSIPGKRKQIARINIDLAFGDSKTHNEKEAILERSTQNLVAAALQCLWLQSDTQYRAKQLLEEDPKGLDALKKCLDRGKGVFFLSAHFGNWEFMAINHGYMGLGKLHPIVRRLDNPLLESVTEKLRTASGNELFYREDPPLRIVRALKNNHCVGVMMDQNTAKGGVFVDFFGRKAATARSVALLSYKIGAAILPLFSYPTGRGTWRIEYGPEIHLEKTGDKEADLLTWTQACESFIEEKVRLHPECWMWAHRRWKTRPPEEGGAKIY